MTVFDVITLFPQEIANWECFDSICLVPDRIDSVLPRWRDNLLSISQLLRDNKLSPKTFSIVFMCFPDTNRAELSAWSISLQETYASISLTYIKKKEEAPGLIPVVLHKEQPWGQKKIHLHQ